MFGDATTKAHLLDAQVHAALADPALVEQGQLILMKVATPQDGGNGDDVVNGDATANILSGNNGDDLIRGGSGNDVLHGNNGNDTIEGWADDDTLFGDNGNDVLRGDAGDDLLIGGRGNDTLTGGVGADRFDFSGQHAESGNGRGPGFGADTITDFVHGEDHIVLEDGQSLRARVGDFNHDGIADTMLTLTAAPSPYSA